MVKNGIEENELRKTLSFNIKKQRKILGLTQEKLAEATGLSSQTINDIEGCRMWVSDKTLENLADVLKIESFQLLLPIKNFDEKAINPDDAIKKLEKIKRVFDDSFNEIINLTKNAEKKDNEK